MTGHGRGEHSQDGYKAVVELAGGNRRQLEIRVSLPREFESLEGEIRERLQRRLSRGRVSVRGAVLTAKGEDLARVVLNEALARECATRLRELAATAGIEGAVGIDSVTRIPGVLRVEAGVENAKWVGILIPRALDKALVGMLAMRRAEGEKLGEDLRRRMDRMRRATAKVERRAPKVLARYRKQLLERVRQAGIEGVEMDDERLLKEVVLFADRSDISEELTRLQSHFDQFDARARSRQAVGRTLDFLAQEIHREVNTIGAKANDALISKEVVSIKTELEKFREQCPAATITAAYPARFAWEESASIFCARVVRGTISMHTVVTPRCASAATSGPSLNGSRKLTCTAPSGSSATASADGLRTRSTTSDATTAESMSATTSAPASR